MTSYGLNKKVNLVILKLCGTFHFQGHSLGDMLILVKARNIIGNYTLIPN